MQGVSWRVTQKPPARLLSPDARAKDFANLARREYKAGRARGSISPIPPVAGYLSLFSSRATDFDI
jgi:hypothetical protein